MDSQKKLKLLLIEYIKEQNNKVELLDLLAINPEIINAKGGEYPDFHRIIDIQLESKIYRVCRQISKNEYITFIEIEKLMSESGVPLWLSGDKLKLWAELEDDSDIDTKTETNWNQYL